MQALKVEQWDQRKASEEIPRRLKEALDFRRRFEPGWRANESVLFRSDGSAGSGSEASVSYGNLAELFAGDLDSGDSWITINYTFRYIRFLHAQMSANPPSVTPRPTSQDYKDRRAAEVADHLITYGRRQYAIQDRTDMTCLQTLMYGSGILRTKWDPLAGDALEYDEATSEITMTGDHKFVPILIWDFAMDPTARHWDDVRYVFERHLLSVEEAQFRFPDSKDKLQKAAVSSDRAGFWDKDQGGAKMPGRVAIWEYTERALPWNGMAGRRMFLLEGGEALSDIEANPNPEAILGYHLLTDIDVPGQVYGKSVIDYAIRLQDVLNRLDSTVLDNIQAHGSVRMVTFDAAEGEEGNEPTNSGWIVYNVKGGAANKPEFIDPPSLMPDIYKFRQQLVDGLEQIFGVNESSFGQVKREMSGFSMQTAINASNTVRRRLYNKFTAFVESLYKAYLMFVQKYWTDERQILVTGEEGALSVVWYSGADIADGFDIDAEYGATFSLDPASRREEIMQVLPLLKEAGYSMRSILRMLKLNDVGGLFDMSETGARRQLEIFDEMIAKFEEHGLLVFIAPEKLEEHQSMLEAAYEFRMSMAYKVLARPLKLLIDRHIEAREARAAEAAAPGKGGPGGPAVPNAAAAGPLAAMAGGGMPPLGGPPQGPGAAPTAPGPGAPPAPPGPQ
jgi:hypothetical protein